MGDLRLEIRIRTWAPVHLLSRKCLSYSHDGRKRRQRRQGVQYVHLSSISFARHGALLELAGSAVMCGAQREGFRGRLANYHGGHNVSWLIIRTNARVPAIMCDQAWEEMAPDVSRTCPLPPVPLLVCSLTSFVCDVHTHARAVSHSPLRYSLHSPTHAHPRTKRSSRNGVGRTLALIPYLVCSLTSLACEMHTHVLLSFPHSATHSTPPLMPSPEHNTAPVMESDEPSLSFPYLFAHSLHSCARCTHTRAVSHSTLRYSL